MDTLKIEIRKSVRAGKPQYAIFVHEFKYDTIRQESYWVSSYLRTYTDLKAAKARAARFDAIAVECFDTASI